MSSLPNDLLPIWTAAGQLADAFEQFAVFKRVARKYNALERAEGSARVWSHEELNQDGRARMLSYLRKLAAERGFCVWGLPGEHLDGSTTKIPDGAWKALDLDVICNPLNLNKGHDREKYFANLGALRVPETGCVKWAALRVRERDIRLLIDLNAPRSRITGRVLAEQKRGRKRFYDDKSRRAVISAVATLVDRVGVDTLQSRAWPLSRIRKDLKNSALKLNLKMPARTKLDEWIRESLRLVTDEM